MSTNRFTNFPNIRAALDRLEALYDPEHDCGGDVDFTHIDYKTLVVIAKLTHEVETLEKRVYDLECQCRSQIFRQ